MEARILESLEMHFSFLEKLKILFRIMEARILESFEIYFSREIFF